MSNFCIFRKPDFSTTKPDLIPLYWVYTKRMKEASSSTVMLGLTRILNEIHSDFITRCQ